MSASFLLLCISAAATIAYATSALTLPLAVALRRGALPLAARAEARVLLALAVLPAIVSAAALAVSLAPSLSAVHHCLGGADPHEHHHLCIEHHAGVFPRGLPVVLGGYLVLALVAAVSGFARTTLEAGKLQAALGGTARAHADYLVLPFREPQAFLVGFVRPQLFVTEGLLGPHAEHLDVVLAHERAHVRHRDPLSRTLARLALCFHLPVYRAWLERALDLGQEMAADAEAAGRVGSRERVARALLQLSRAAMPPRPALTGFAVSHVERRVERLLQSDAGIDAPSPRSLLIASALALGALFVASGPVHHGLEVALGLLGN